MLSFKHLGIFLAFLAMLVVELIYQVVVATSHDVLVGPPGFDVCGLEVCWECCFGEDGYIPEEVSSLFGFIIVFSRVVREVWKNHVD